MGANPEKKIPKDENMKRSKCAVSFMASGMKLIARWTNSHIGQHHRLSKHTKTQLCH